MSILNSYTVLGTWGIVICIFLFILIVLMGCYYRQSRKKLPSTNSIPDPIAYRIVKIKDKYYPQWQTPSGVWCGFKNIALKKITYCDTIQSAEKVIEEEKEYINSTKPIVVKEYEN
jgi:hypothetical protein